MKFLNWFNKKKQQILEKISRVVVLNTNMGTAHWPSRDYNNFANETYMKNVIAFRCMMEIGKAIASVGRNWHLYNEVDGENIQVDDHPIVNLLKRPNPDDSFAFLTMKLGIFLLIAGNGYIEKASPDGGINKGIPKELYILRPDKIKIETDQNTGQIIKYIYDNEIDFDIDSLKGTGDLLHIKLFHPTDDFFGASITESIAREVDTSNEAIEWQKKILENEGRPGMIYAVKGFLSDEQWDRLEKQLKDNYAGSNNAGKTIILESEGGADVKSYNWSPKELDFIESNRELSRRICLGYGVPPMLLGIPGDNTYSNMKEARMGFWEDTVIFWLNLIRDEMNNWLFNEDANKGLFLDIDLNNVPALAIKRQIIWDMAQKSDFLTIDEKRKMVGLEKLPDGKGNVLLVSMNMTALDTITASMDGINDQQTQQEDEQAQQNLIHQTNANEEDAKKLLGLTY